MCVGILTSFSCCAYLCCSSGVLLVVVVVCLALHDFLVVASMCVGISELCSLW